MTVRPAGHLVVKVGGQRPPRAVAVRAVDVQLQAVPTNVAYRPEWKRAEHGANRNAAARPESLCQQ